MTGSTRSSTGCTRWSELGSKVSLLTAIVFALLVVACSPSGPAPEPSATINESASSTVVSSSASSDESNDQQNGQGPWIIRWLVALGPSGPVGNGDLGHETY